MKRWAAALVVLLLASPLHAARAENPASMNVSISWLTGSIYLVADEAFDILTNSLVYIGHSHVTVIGASWTPETAELVATQIKEITSLPITEVIDTSPDPEWSGGNGLLEAHRGESTGHRHYRESAAEYLADDGSRFSSSPSLLSRRAAGLTYRST